MCHDTIDRMTDVEVCREHGAAYTPLGPMDKLGISTNLASGQQPLNGLRHTPSEGTSGWYLWAGETLSDSRDFFEPVHFLHLNDICPEVMPYLSLPPGWRFLLAGEYVDVWFDESLLTE
jgi:hypothetical protein